MSASCKGTPRERVGKGLRQREKETSPFTRYLNARIVGAPEAIYRAPSYHLQSGAPVVHVSNKSSRMAHPITAPVGAERARREKVAEGGELSDANYELRFHDGPDGVYSKRPYNDLFDDMLYPDFHSSYEKGQAISLSLSSLSLSLA